MNPEISPSTQGPDDDFEALLASFDEAVKLPYALSERPVPPVQPAVVDRETADKLHAEWKAALQDSDYDNLPPAELVAQRRAARAAQEAAALARDPYVPHTVRPGGVAEKMAGYRERNLL